MRENTLSDKNDAFSAQFIVHFRSSARRRAFPVSENTNTSLFPPDNSRKPFADAR